MDHEGGGTHMCQWFSVPRLGCNSSEASKRSIDMSYFGACFVVYVCEGYWIVSSTILGACEKGTRACCFQFTKIVYIRKQNAEAGVYRWLSNKVNKKTQQRMDRGRKASF
jgi:hypothetical protein